MKYIIFKQKDLIIPIIFPDIVAHSAVTIADAVPISAGFCTLNVFSVEVYGHSESLKLKSDVKDSEYLRKIILNDNNTNSYFDTNW